MIQEYIKAFSLIFLAEMGDKTQLLALAFATQFPLWKVLSGIALGSFLNHSLAIALGIYISNFISTNTIQIAAGFAFVGFSIWTLKVEYDEDEDNKNSSLLGPIGTVALAFFIGELGDKTQLTAVALSIESINPAVTVAGTVSGMLVTGGLGILAGRFIVGKIPEMTVKMIASVIFMAFGLIKLNSSVPAEYMTNLNVSLFILLVAGLSIFALLPYIRIRKLEVDSSLKIRLRELHDYYVDMNQRIERICLGSDKCGDCMGYGCPVGCIKAIIMCKLGDSSNSSIEDLLRPDKTHKDFPKDKVLECIDFTNKALLINRSQEEKKDLELIKALLEEILN